MKVWILPPLLLLAVACGEEDTGPEMRPGDNCMQCHSSGGEAEEKPWTAAGTVFPASDSAKTDGLQGATVRITAADGKTIALTSNAAGNFFTGTHLATPLTVEVEYQGRVSPMPIPAPSGACNDCHAIPPKKAAPGRVAAP